MVAYEFDLEGAPIPQDSGRDVATGLSRLIPALHGRRGVQVAPIGGARSKTDPSKLILSRGSKLLIRGISEEEALSLRDKALAIGGSIVAIRGFKVRQLFMQGRLASRIVIYNDKREDRDHPVHADPCDQQGFMIYLLRQLKLYGADTSKLKIAIGKRRSMAFKGMKMLGFSVSITGCDEPLTNLILANGLGDFQADGCGVFRGYSRS